MARRRKSKPSTQQGNARVVKVTLKSVLSAAMFVKGFNEVRKGKPFNSDLIEESKQWPYERGRLFGCLYTGQLKQGRNVTVAACIAFSEAWNDKLIT